MEDPFDDLNTEAPTNQVEDIRNYKFDSIINASPEVQEFIRALTEPFSSVAAQIQLFVRNLEPYIEACQRISNGLDRLPDEMRVATGIAAQRGWYLPEDTPVSAFRSVSGSTPEDLDREMVEYWSSNLSTCEDRIQGAFPNRGKIISKAINAHRAGDYELSIPVFLAQADGICQEVTGFQAYARTNGRPHVAKYVDGIDPFMAAFMTPLAVIAPITWTDKERIGKSCIMNRHAVLHGVSLDYGTEINSLKAVSFLSFVASTLSYQRARLDQGPRNELGR